MLSIQTLLLTLRHSQNGNTKWENEIKETAIDLILRADNEDEKETVASIKDLEHWLLNGAETWSDYSYGGFALIYDEEIARTYCNDKQYAEWQSEGVIPNGIYSMHALQTRALEDAMEFIRRACHPKNYGKDNVYLFYPATNKELSECGKYEGGYGYAIPYY